jgi:hypothetical protein
VAALTVAVAVAAVFIAVSPGLEFHNAYTWLVFAPEKLTPNLGIPWTYNPAWLVAFIGPLVSLPGRIGLVLFIVISIVAIVTSSHILKGNAIVALLSAQMAWILWWGQIDGIVVLGVALGWLALEKRMWWLMWLALALATLKPQIGLVPVMAIWWWSESKTRWWSLLGFIALVVFSLWVWGLWPVWVLKGIVLVAQGTQYGSWNSSLGLWALPLFVPAVLMPLERRQRLLALTATAMLVSPYMPYYSTILLLCMPIPGWAYAFAFLGYLPNLLSTAVAWNGIVLLPITVLMWLYFPPAVHQFRKLIARRTRVLARPASKYT